jgi:phosphatidylserine/phosphatidylglycerophosphate/cardiolipin synthase-like enzyme
VRHDASDANHIHHKFAIVDGRKLATGSFNWTFQAVTAIQEIVLLTQDPKTVARYVQEFDTLAKAFANNTFPSSMFQPNAHQAQAHCPAWTMGVASNSIYKCVRIEKFSKELQSVLCVCVCFLISFRWM